MAVTGDNVTSDYLLAAAAARQARGIVDGIPYDAQGRPIDEGQRAAQLINAVNTQGAQAALASYGFSEANLYAIPAGLSLGEEAGAMPFLEGLRREATLRAQEASAKTAAAVEVQETSADEVSRRRRARGTRAAPASLVSGFEGGGLLS